MDRYGRAPSAYSCLCALGHSRPWCVAAPQTSMAGTSPAITHVNTIGLEEVTANFYFFAGAILESFAASGALVSEALVSEALVSEALVSEALVSAALASGLAVSGFAASGVAAGVLAAWSMRSILAPSRSLAT